MRNRWKKQSPWLVLALLTATCFFNCARHLQSENGVTVEQLASVTTPLAEPPTTPTAVSPLGPLEPGVTGQKTSPISIFNPVDSFDFVGALKTANDILPAGAGYTDSVPATLDLASVAAEYIGGVTRTANPYAYFVPTAAALSPEFSYGSAKGPALVVNYWGAPNWGEVMLAMAQAREMTSFDRNNAQNTVNTQYHMLKNMLDVNADVATGSATVLINQTPAASAYAMQALLKHWEQKANPNVLAMLDYYLRAHQSHLQTFNDNRRSYRAFYANLAADPADPGLGVKGPHYVPFVQATMSAVANEWRSILSENSADAMNKDLTDFMLGYQNSVLWQSPDAAIYPFAGAQGFAGHMYSYLEAVRAILMTAVATQKENPDVAVVYGIFGQQIYEFVKNRTKAGYVGNFGSCGTTSSMIQIGILLSELGIADHYDEVDAWTRNQIMDCQIDEEKAAYIGNNSSSDWKTDHVGLKVRGLFFADATHLRGIPGQAQGFTSDDHAMAFRGLYEVWKKTLDFRGDTATIHFHLNRVSPYIDLKSENPYRGRLEIITRATIGNIKKILVRKPFGSKAQVFLRDSAGGYNPYPFTTGQGAFGNYLLIDNVKPSQTFAVTYPMFIWNPRVYQMRQDDSPWYEGSFPAPNFPEVVKSWPSTFRGTTLVKIDSADPVVGIPRFQQAWRQGLSSLDATGGPAPMMMQDRFVASSCRIRQAVCPDHPLKVGVFFDDHMGAAISETACIKRASEYHQWCGMKPGQTSTAEFLSAGQILRQQVIGTACQIEQSVCPKNPGPTFTGSFVDTLNGASKSPEACLKRAQEFYDWCGMSGGQSSKATYFEHGVAQRSVVVN